MTSTALVDPGPYLEELAAALRALGPSDDWVPLDAALRHLACLHPRLTGGLFGGAATEDDGLPDGGWMDEVVAEQALAAGAPAPADPDRARAWAILAQGPVLDRRREGVAARSLEGQARRRFWCDRRAPGAGWIRVSADVDGGEVEALQARLGRHLFSPPAALAAVLHEAGGRPTRVCRAGVGPLWRPGGAARPPWEAPGACLHVWREVWEPGAPAGEADPLAAGGASPSAWRERRFGVDRAAEPALRAWLDDRGARCAVRSFGRA